MKTHETARSSLMNIEDRPSLLRKKNHPSKREGQLTSLLKYEILESDQGNSPVNYSIDDSSGVLLGESQPALVRESENRAEHLVRGTLDHNLYADGNLNRTSLGQQRLARDSLAQTAPSIK